MQVFIKSKKTFLILPVSVQSTNILILILKLQHCISSMYIIPFLEYFVSLYIAYSKIFRNSIRDYLNIIKSCIYNIILLLQLNTIQFNCCLLYLYNYDMTD